jgi:hypothetical protein
MNPRHSNNRSSHYLNVNARSGLFDCPSVNLRQISHVQLLCPSVTYEIFLLKRDQAPIPVIREYKPIRECVISIF